MPDKIRITRLWEYKHPRPIDSLSLAGISGDTLIADRRERVILLDSSGAPVWDQTVNFSPLAARVTDEGENVFILTSAGRLMRVTRDAEVEWDNWFDKHPITLAIKSKGQSAVVLCQRGRLHVVNSRGERARLLHTPVAVAHASITSRTGALFVASAHGWLGRYDNRFNPMGELSLDMPISEVTLSGRGGRIFLPALKGGLNIIDLGDSGLTTYDPGFPVVKVGVDEKGEKILAVGLDGNMALMNTAGDMLWKEKSAHSWILCEMNRPGDRFVVVSGKGLVACYGIGARKADPGETQFDYLEV